MQLDDRVTGLEQKLIRTTTVLYVVVAVLLVVMGINLYMALRQSISFDRILVRDSIEIGDPKTTMILGHSRLQITNDEYGEVLLAPGLLKIENTSLTGDKLTLNSGPTQIVAEVSDDEGIFRIVNDSGNFSVILGGPLSDGTLTLHGNKDEVVSVRVSNGDAKVQVQNSKSMSELKP